MSNLPAPDDIGARAPGKAGDSESPQQKLHAMLAGIWEKSKQTIAERIGILQQAQILAASDSLDEAARLRAVDAAHKLAGVLGTFGLPRGTELAREVEETFGNPAAWSPTTIQRLASLLDELDSLIKTAGPSTRGAGS
jgi:HPt (histidine-containing phosphotransfer) domain-containing protein